MAQLYNHRQVSSILCYTPTEICNLFVNNKLTVKKVNTWIKNGLPVISNGRPLLIAGPELIKFLKKLNIQAKTNLEFAEFFCCSCKMAHIPLGRKISVNQHDNFIRAKGICPDTRKTMIKVFKLSDFGKIKNIFSVVEEKRLYDSDSPLLKHQKSVLKPQQTKLSL